MDEPAHPMAIGLDLGTSGVKAVLTSADGRLRAESSCVLAVRRPRQLWSEQHPADWDRRGRQRGGCIAPTVE